MSVLKCLGCGGTTNTATSEWMKEDGNIVRNKTYDMAARHCYAKTDTDTGKWVKGCGYDKANAFDKGFVDQIIGT